MKKIITLCFLLASFLTFAQVPQGVSYQAIALNSSGSPVLNSNVRVRISVLDSNANGTVLYSETQQKTTNAQGLFNLVIGQGTVVSGVFSAINWSVNSKFLKVEMDATGGTNFVTVGTTQLLSVPYAMAADSLITSPGEGITLVSPNGTPYQLTVSDSGQLSLPTSSQGSTAPNQMYMYGSFNNFDANTALLTRNTGNYFLGYKYLTSGTQLKYLAQNNPNATVYGVNSSMQLAVGGSAYIIPSNGFYFVSVNHGSSDNMYFGISQFAPVIENRRTYAEISPTFNASTNTFTFIVNGVTDSDSFLFDAIPTSSGGSYFGDFLGDGTIDQDGTEIQFPNATTTPKNYRVNLVINFNGSGTYTITQL